MKHKKLAVNIILTVAALLLPLGWCVGTNSGLNTVLKTTSLFLPGSIAFESTSGTLLTKTLSIRNLRYSENGHILAISQANINWRQAELSLHQVTGFEPYLPSQQLIAAGKKSTIDQVNAKITFANDEEQLTLTLHGTWQDAPLSANIIAKQSSGNWSLQKSNVKIAENSLKITPALDDSYAWELNIPQPQLLLKNGSGALHATGNITHSSKSNNISAKIISKAFRFAEYSLHNLRAELALSDVTSAPLHINITADQISADQHTIKSVKVVATGTLGQQDFKATAKHDQNNIIISASGAIENNKWISNSLLLKYNTESLTGNATVDIKHNQAELILNGNPFAINTELLVTLSSANKISAKLNLRTSSQNHLQALISSKDRDLEGAVNIVAEDISMLMKFLPDVTRLKGLFKAEAHIAGTLDKPTVTASAHLTQITATLPALGVKIKPMELHLQSDGLEKFVIKGSGKMRRGPGEFKITGHIEPFKPNFPHSILFVAKNLEFIKNETAQLTANTELNFNVDNINQQLNIKGHIDILGGNIYFKHKKINTVKTKDVVFVDSKPYEQHSSFTVHPDLSIWIHDGVHFSGLGLDAEITGNLDVTQRRDTLYGNGRVTIKQGTFKLPGQILEIKKGRLLYPPGTLLANPSLDIKMQGRVPNISQNSMSDPSELEIFVRGTAQDPLIHESNIATNRDKALSQIMLAGSSLISKNALQDKLKLTELGLKSTDDQIPNFFYNPSKQKSSQRDKDLVIGRPIGDKLYMQYLQSMGEPNKRIKLKYALSDIWALGVETGERGSGADLSFAIERD